MVMITTMRTRPLIATMAMITPTITIITPPWQASPPSLTVWIFQTR